MNAVVIASTVFALILGGAMVGMWLRAVLSFDRINNSRIENATRIVVLDHVLQSYGKEAEGVRVSLKNEYGSRVGALTSGSAAELTLRLGVAFVYAVGRTSAAV